MPRIRIIRMDHPRLVRSARAAWVERRTRQSSRIRTSPPSVAMYAAPSGPRVTAA